MHTLFWVVFLRKESLIFWKNTVHAIRNKPLSISQIGSYQSQQNLSDWHGSLACKGLIQWERKFINWYVKLYSVFYIWLPLYLECGLWSYLKNCWMGMNILRCDYWFFIGCKEKEQILVWTVIDMENYVSVDIRPLLIVQVYELLLSFDKNTIIMLWIASDAVLFLSWMEKESCLNPVPLHRLTLL